MKIILLFVALLLLYFSGNAVSLVSSRETVQIGKSKIEMRVADNEVSRRLGLMYVKELPKDSGLLFVFDDSQIIKMWMKNTYIPLDMIFLDASGKVVHLHKSAVPHNLDSISSQVPAKYVIEVNEGVIARSKIKLGDVIALPGAL